MALALHSATMAGAEERTVHPFFVPNRERADSVTAASSGDHSGSEGLATTQPQGKKPQRRQRQRKSSKSNTGNGGSNTQQLQFTPGGMQAGQPLLQRPKIVDPVALDELQIDDEAYNSERGRKRRRITPSPEEHVSSNRDGFNVDTTGTSGSVRESYSVPIDTSKLNLEEQLIHAAFGQSSPHPSPQNNHQAVSELVRPGSPTGTKGPAMEGLVQPETPSRKPLQTPSTTPSTRSSSKKKAPVRSSPRNKGRDVPTLRDTHDVPMQKVEHDSGKGHNIKTPPKKMLKLRTDGKLISPKTSQEGVNGHGQDRKGAGQSLEPGRKLLRIKYGSDEVSRSAVGQKIESIISKPAASNPKSRPVRSKKAHGAPKALHPFFAPKAQSILPESGVTDDCSSAVDSGPSNNTHNSSLPSQKKQQLAASSWAGFGSSFSKPVKFPGSVEPLWPPRDMMHPRRLPTGTELGDMVLREPPREKKLKSVVHVSAADDVLLPYEDLIRSYCPERFRESESNHAKPKRRLMSGIDLQFAIKKRAKSRLPAPERTDGDSLGSQILLSTSQISGHNTPHKAVLELYYRLKTSLGPFDRFECENQDWCHKYAPKSTFDVLQEDASLQLLRDWLISLTVTSVDSGRATPNPPDFGRKLREKAKKKRKRLEDLDGFIVSDEEGYVDEVTDPEDTVASETRTRLPRLNSTAFKSTKAVIISGPNGCGKSALAYAVAQELGFEIFEINPGMRRSGKDLMDKIGDMTKNHLVRQISAPDDGKEAVEINVEYFATIQADVESGRQKTMGSFFKASPKSKPRGRPPKSKRKNSKSPKKPSKQRQSLILLEEVDVLFEEDKHFWNTVQQLLVHSRRPIIMTCKNENTLNTEELLNCRVIHLGRPSTDLAAEYLLMMAANEGHLLSLRALQKLYESQKCDLRASITHLNFFCQMAIGDSKGGLEWMPIRSRDDKWQNEFREPLRVISDGTFTNHMGFLTNTCEPLSVDPLNTDILMLTEAATNWSYDVENWSQFLPKPGSEASSGEPSLGSLDDFVQGSEALSAADVMPGSWPFDFKSTPLDASMGALSDSTRVNYTEDLRVMNDVSRHDYDIRGLDIVLTLKLLSRHLFLHSTEIVANEDLLTHHLTKKILTHKKTTTTSPKAYTNTLLAALRPLCEPAKNNILGHRSPGISTIDYTQSVRCTDIAPYVRTIANFDLDLEHQRAELSKLLSQGGRPTKHRTTRASRAALEGGSKASTRRERWFDKELNLQSVVQTGGLGWKEAADDVLSERRAKAEEQRVGQAHPAGEDEGEDEREVSSPVPYGVNVEDTERRVRAMDLVPEESLEASSAGLDISVDKPVAYATW